MHNEIRNIVLEMERQNLRKKINYDVNQDLDEDLFKSVKSRLMLIEYELNSDKCFVHFRLNICFKKKKQFFVIHVDVILVFFYTQLTIHFECFLVSVSFLH